jgi:hypothetical protein
MARLCRALSVALLFFSIPFGFHLLTGGFRAQKVLFDLYPNNLKNWDSDRAKVSGLNDQNPNFSGCLGIDLKGPFFYLGRGLQCYAFTDRSGEFVIKLFRSDLRRHRTPQLFEKKIRRTFDSYTLAYNHLQEETGLLALHLNATQGILPNAIFYDRMAIPHTLPLDQLYFVVQRRATSFTQTLMQANSEELPQLIDSLHQLIEKRIACGIHKTDGSLPANVGFIGMRAIEFDCGDYIDLRADSSNQWKELERLSVQTSLNNWLMRHIPLKDTQED